MSVFYCAFFSSSQLLNYFSIAAAIAQTFSPTAELATPIGIPTKLR